MITPRSRRQRHQQRSSGADPDAVGVSVLDSMMIFFM
jgi:hypothetical protein